MTLKNKSHEMTKQGQSNEKYVTKYQTIGIPSPQKEAK
jgi:hypothetical protein